MHTSQEAARQIAIAVLQQCHTEIHGILYQLTHQGSAEVIKPQLARVIAKIANALAAL